MRFEFFIGQRYLASGQKQKFITLITVLSVLGVSMGVMALIIVIGVMTGFEADLKKRVLGVESHILVRSSQGSFSKEQNIIRQIETIPGVQSAGAYIYTQVMLRTSLSLAGAELRGIDPLTHSTAVQNLNLPSLAPRPGLPGIIIGRNLAADLGVMQGDIVYVVAPRGMLSPMGHLPTMKRFKVVHVFHSGMYEYDGKRAFIHLQEARKVLRMGTSVTGIEVRVDQIDAADRIADRIVSKLGSPFMAESWQQMNRNLFSALRLEKAVMFIILTLIILVAAFNIAATLIMTVIGKKRDIAILKAMGATNKQIGRIFVFKGLVIGAVGTIIGDCLGVCLCVLLKHYKFIKLPSDVYLITTLPVQLQSVDVGVISGAALLICFAVTLYPARHAARMNPVEILRYG